MCALRKKYYFVVKSKYKDRMIRKLNFFRKTIKITQIKTYNHINSSFIKLIFPLFKKKVKPTFYIESCPIGCHSS